VIVEGDVVGDAGSELVDGGEGVPVEVLVLEDRPEALGTGVVETTPGGSHGPNQAHALAEVNRPENCGGSVVRFYAAELVSPKRR
jgi:hypothetical protein